MAAVQFMAGDTLGNVTNVSATTPLPMSSTVGGAAVSTSNPEPNTAIPTTSATSGIAPIATRDVTALQLKTSAGNFYSASMTNGTTAGFFILYNAAATPAAAAALTANLILLAVPVAASGFASLGGNPIPARFTAGAQLLFSTSLSTYTVPATPALHVTGQAV